MPQAENKVAFANPESKTMSADEQAQVTTQTESDVATSHKKGGASSGTDGGLKAKEPSERRGSKSKEVTIAKRGPPPPLDLENLLTIMTKLGQGRAFRDVFARFWQYGGRAISGFYLDEGVWWRDLERTGSMCRKWMRFFMPIAAYRAIRQFNSIPKLNPDLKFWMTGESFFNSIYCLVDHVIFLQNINLIKADAVHQLALQAASFVVTGNLASGGTREASVSLHSDRSCGMNGARRRPSRPTAGMCTRTHARTHARSLPHARTHAHM